MKYKKIQLFLVGLLFCFIFTLRPTVETQIKLPEAPRTIKKHQVNKYVSPTGKVLKIAEKVSKETNVPCETISKIMYFESSYNSTLIHRNKNRTYDSGLFQINSIWKPYYKNLQYI